MTSICVFRLPSVKGKAAMNSRRAGTLHKNARVAVADATRVSHANERKGRKRLRREVKAAIPSHVRQERESGDEFQARRDTPKCE
jgi:hypothetical protein